MHAINQQASTGPYRPAAYFSPGNYSFIKDATEIWWDSSGQSPGGAPGCYRLSDNGARHRADWTAGDAEIHDPANAPCQGDQSQT